MFDMAERVYTLQEAAERLHMPYRTLRDAVYQGRFPHRMISQRRRLMTEADIAAVLALTAKTPAPATTPVPVDWEATGSTIKAFLQA